MSFADLTCPPRVDQSLGVFGIEIDKEIEKLGKKIKREAFHFPFSFR